MTRLRHMMLEELQRRNYSKSTARCYVRAVADFARHCGKSPDQLGPDELRRYQAYLLRERKLAVGTVIARIAALRFFFIRTLKRHAFREDLLYPKDHRRLITRLEEEPPHAPGARPKQRKPIAKEFTDSSCLLPPDTC